MRSCMKALLIFNLICVFSLTGWAQEPKSVSCKISENHGAEERFSEAYPANGKGFFLSTAYTERPNKRFGFSVRVDYAYGFRRLEIADLVTGSNYVFNVASGFSKNTENFKGTVQATISNPGAPLAIVDCEVQYDEL